MSGRESSTRSRLDGAGTRGARPMRQGPERSAPRGRMIKLADALILTAAFISFLFSVGLWFGLFGPADREAGMFVGIWVPSILSAGAYFKLATRGGRHG